MIGSNSLFILKSSASTNVCCERKKGGLCLWLKAVAFNIFRVILCILCSLAVDFDFEIGIIYGQFALYSVPKITVSQRNILLKLFLTLVFFLWLDSNSIFKGLNYFALTLCTYFNVKKKKKKKWNSLE